MTGNSTPSLLEVSRLVVEFKRGGSAVRPVTGASFTLGARQRLGLVGESGSGKSLTALSIMRLLPPRGRIAEGRVLLGGSDLVQMSESEMAAVRGARVALVGQDPMSSLNPVQTVGRQLVEAIRTHEKVAKRVARRRAVELLSQVGLTNAEARFDSYPHQFSGGMRQRVMIAMAVSANPDVVIADEPTTALDVTTQARIIDLLSTLVEERHMAVILITHDLGLAASFCDDIQVMYAGRIVERSRPGPLFARPNHPYTEALLNAICRLDDDISKPIATIPGQPPLPQALPSGCAFHPRCPRVFERCAGEVPALRTLPGERSVACHLGDPVSAVPA